MPVRIRMALHGCTNRPFFHIVVARSRAPRNGRHIEQVGSYDPMPNYNGEQLVGLNIDRIKYWLSVGAQPTVSVYKIFSLAGILPLHPRLLLEASRKREAARAVGQPGEGTELPTQEPDDDIAPNNTTEVP